MSLSNSLENDVLKMILKGVDPAWRASASQYIALFKGDPGEVGSIAQEADYTGYARVALTKASAWADGGSTFTNADLIQFGVCTAGNNALTHFAIVDTASGAGNMMYSGPMSITLNVSAPIQPQINAGSLSITVD